MATARCQYAGRRHVPRHNAVPTATAAQSLQDLICDLLWTESGIQQLCHAWHAGEVLLQLVQGLI
jgi:hypothetical protein